jgi:hypothetical protein
VDTQQVESDDLEGEQPCPEGQESQRGLERMKNEEEGWRKRKASSLTPGGPSSRLSKASMMMLVIGLAMSDTEAANVISKATGWEVCHQGKDPCHPQPQE